MNNQNIHQINSDIEKAFNIAKLIKDNYDQSKKILETIQDFKLT